MSDYNVMMLEAENGRMMKEASARIKALAKMKRQAEEQGRKLDALIEMVNGMIKARQEAV